ncbi:Hypothetical protein PHPALM_3790, partial [Phytophthora palmivora]
MTTASFDKMLGLVRPALLHDEIQSERGTGMVPITPDESFRIGIGSALEYRG